MRLIERSLAAVLLASTVASSAVAQANGTPDDAIRVNQVGYLPDAPKVAVVCALAPRAVGEFEVVTEAGKRVFGPKPTTDAGAFGPCAQTYRLDFTALREPGTYRIRAGDLESRVVKIGPTVWNGLADMPLRYMRQQRSGFNPIYNTTVHTKDGIIVDHPTRAGEYLPATGGWADASDYLQYVTTSATAAFQLLQAYRDNPKAFGDEHQANGLPGANGIPDVLDEARHGLAWLVRMYPDDSLMLNQLGDDRDHMFFDLPPNDSADYGWGKGGARPLYPCTGIPQGLLRYQNRATGYASTAGKFAAAFALGAQLLRERDRAFADTLRSKAVAAFALGERYPGACQTAPGRGAYYYEEDDWEDDMELGAAALYGLTRDVRYQAKAIGYAAKAKVKPWMGADTANHYQWYPWHNIGHYEAARGGTLRERLTLSGYYRTGLAAVAKKADNGFRAGIPFIWCSNDLMTSLAVTALWYRRITGDNQFRELEQAAIDWLFGVNPWGVSMVIGVPADGNFARDPHAVISVKLKYQLDGGLLDGPVYSSIYKNLAGISLTKPDAYAKWNTGHIVYHDDWGDYSTNEPIMDGAANMAYLLSWLGKR
ncbi:MAG: glycoside hydrolase family 9 protein [Gemmatimonadetes bacterium]|nr:glycoside hydrolase family 9 protein [Gemmatimonadota bacterium]